MPAHLGNALTKTLHTEPNTSTDPSKVTLPEGYTVIVTGAGKGIGQYIARAYAQARASNIIITARTSSDLDQVRSELEQIAQTNGTAITVRTFASDASKLETFQELRSIVEKDFGGRLDCLINNAGRIGSNSGFNRLDKTDPLEHAQLFELNYLGPMYAMQQLIPVMTRPENKGRLIINITSMAAHMANNRVPVAYAASKHALNRLTQHVGETYQDEGLNCIALHPGGVMSYSAQFVPDAMKASKSILCLEVNIENKADFRHPVLKDDITLCGAVCVWFSKEHRPWASGRFINCKWDVDELEAQKDSITGEDKLKFRMVV
jgi:NAD(P)-dependent dehydrogenase (short-subunit alcohol dehydrogenase family)